MLSACPSPGDARCVVGASGSAKTGALLVMVEEALRCGVPTLMLDVKGDLPNLLLAFPQLTAVTLLPWTVDGAQKARPFGEKRA